MPARLAELAEEALTDPDLVALREDIATLEGFIVEELQGMSVTSSAEMWRAAMEACTDLRKTIELGEETMVVSKAKIEALVSILENGLGDQQRKSKIVGMSEIKARIAAVEHKRAIHLETFVGATEMAVMMSVILSILKEEVPDVETRRRIGERLNGIVHSQPRQLAIE